MVSYRQKGLTNYLIRPLFWFLQKKKGIVILTFHNICKSDYDWFGEIIDYLYRNYEFANYSDFKEANKLFSETKIFISFDDGYFSQFYLAKQYLDPYRIKGIFFITENFIGLKGKKAYDFATKNFYPKSEVSFKVEDSDAMSWSDIDYLNKNGHIIGAHSMNHPLFEKIIDRKISTSEYIDSSERISANLGSEIEMFAFPFGGIENLNLRIFPTLQEKFKYIFSNIRGNFQESPSKKFIFRQNISPRDSKWTVKKIIEGKFDWKHKKIRQEAINFFDRARF